MAVIINEFEVVVEPPPQAADQVPPAQHRLTPEDIERILVYFRERRARLLAD